jgi:hypothetical protein
VCGLVVRTVPDVGVDGAGEHEPNLDRRVPQVELHRLGPSRQRELRGAVGRLLQDPDAAAEARHVDDHPAASLEQAGEQRQRHPHGGLEVDRHRVADLLEGDLGDGSALGHRGVVHEDVDPSKGLVGLEDERLGGVGVGQVEDPRPRCRCRLSAAFAHLVELGLPSPDEADGGPALGERDGQRRADPRRLPRDEDVRPRDRHPCPHRPHRTGARHR